MGRDVAPLRPTSGSLVDCGRGSRRFRVLVLHNERAVVLPVSVHCQAVSWGCCAHAFWVLSHMSSQEGFAGDQPGVKLSVFCSCLCSAVGVSFAHSQSSWWCMASV